MPHRASGFRRRPGAHRGPRRSVPRLDPRLQLEPEYAGSDLLDHDADGEARASLPVDEVACGFGGLAPPR